MNKKEIKVEFNLNLADVIITVLIGLISLCYIDYSMNKQAKQLAKEQARVEIIHEHNQSLRISNMKNKIVNQSTNDTRRKNN